MREQLAPNTVRHSPLSDFCHSTAPRPTGEASRLAAVGRSSETSKKERLLKSDATASWYWLKLRSKASSTTKGSLLARERKGFVVQARWGRKRPKLVSISSIRRTFLMCGDLSQMASALAGSSRIPVASGHTPSPNTAHPANGVKTSFNSDGDFQWSVVQGPDVSDAREVVVNVNKDPVQAIEEVSEDALKNLRSSSNRKGQTFCYVLLDHKIPVLQRPESRTSNRSLCNGTSLNTCAGCALNILCTDSNPACLENSIVVSD